MFKLRPTEAPKLLESNGVEPEKVVLSFIACESGRI
jgi:hypothetical protein